MSRISVTLRPIRAGDDTEPKLPGFETAEKVP
jgi:hypothetical protein